MLNQEKEEESILEFSSSDDELDEEQDEDDNYLSDNEFGNVHEIRAKKQEMDSDLDEDDEDDIPNVNAWGSKAGKYFGTDYVDKDGAGITEKDRRIAEVEEEEGIAAQKRLVDELNEFDFDCFEVNKESFEDKLADLNEDAELENLESLSDKEKEDFLRIQSPEFFIFKQDYFRYTEESQTKLRKIIDFCSNAKYDEFRESDLYKFILAKDSLIQRYCVNIAFYMLLKVKGINVKSHPIRSTLNLYRKLVNQTNEYLDDVGLNDFNLIIEKLKAGDFVQDRSNTRSIDTNEEKTDRQINGKRKHKNQSAIKKVRFEEKINSNDELVDNEQVDRSIIEHSKEKRSSNAIEEVQDKEFYSDEEQDEKEVLFVHKRDDVKKRRISKMIEKNKGLTPYRKRDYRNPRVRYKGKYQKAEIKRKSQVKEPVKEIKKYSGEYHGIKTSVVRSVRFK